MYKGYTKRWRSIEEWEWYKTPHMAHFFMHLVGRANRKDGRWQGVEVKRGQLICGRRQLALDTGLSERTVRTCIKRLKSTGEVTIKTTHRFSIITVNEYEKYNSNENGDPQKARQVTNKRPTSDPLATTNKNDKNDKNNNNILRQVSRELPQHLYPLAIYIIGRGTTFLSVEQLRGLISRFARTSKRMKDYPPETLAFAYLLAVEKSEGEYEVQLETMEKSILRALELEPGAAKARKISEIISFFNQYRDVLFTAESPLITT